MFRRRRWCAHDPHLRHSLPDAGVHRELLSAQIVAEYRSELHRVAEADRTGYLTTFHARGRSTPRFGDLLPVVLRARSVAGYWAATSLPVMSNRTRGRSARCVRSLVASCWSGCSDQTRPAFVLPPAERDRSDEVVDVRTGSLAAMPAGRAQSDEAEGGACDQTTRPTGAPSRIRVSRRFAVCATRSGSGCQRPGSPSTITVEPPNRK